MAKEKIRLAVIGVGIIGESHLRTYRDIPEAEVVAICDINEERLNDVGDRFGIAHRYTHIGRMLAEEELGPRQGRACKERGSLEAAA